MAYNGGGQDMEMLGAPPVIEEEALLPIAARAAGDAESIVAVEVSCAPEYDAIPAGETRSNFHVNVSVSTADIAESSSRGGLDLVCIMDVSGSMSGAKIDLVKNAMAFVTEELTDSDRLSLVTFDHRANTILGLTRMGNAGKERARTAISTMQGGGGTDIHSGLHAGMQILQGRAAQNSVTCIFLLTDGQDTQRGTEDAKYQIAMTARANGWPLILFAFGDNHDVAGLSSLAETAGSSYVYVSELEGVADAFGGALGAQLGVCAKKLRLEIVLPGYNATAAGAVLPAAKVVSTTPVVRQHHRGARGIPAITPPPPAPVGDDVARIHKLGTVYPHAISADGRSAVVEFPNLLAGEHRDVCVVMSVPRALTASSVRDYPVLLAPSLSMETVAGFVVQGRDGTVPTHTSARGVVDAPEATRKTFVGQSCLIARPVEVTGPQVRTPAVERQVLRLATAQTVEDAMAFADAGDLERARSMLTTFQATVAASPQCADMGVKALCVQLDDSLRIMSSRYEYSAGRTNMVESVCVAKAQRSVYTKGASGSAYSTVRSAAAQTRGFTSRTPQMSTPVYHNPADLLSAGGMAHMPPPLKKPSTVPAPVSAGEGGGGGEGGATGSAGVGGGLYAMGGSLVSGVFNVLGLGGSASAPSLAASAGAQTPAPASAPTEPPAVKGGRKGASKK